MFLIARFFCKFLHSLYLYYQLLECQTKDSDSCLHLSSNKWKGYFTDWTCSGSSEYCESWAKDMKRCCPETCKSGKFTLTDCMSSSSEGKCIYPNEAQCPEIGTLWNYNYSFVYYLNVIQFWQSIAYWTIFVFSNYRSWFQSWHKIHKAFWRKRQNWQ